MIACALNWGAPDVRYLLPVEGRDIDDVLARSEALRPRLDAMQQADLISGYDMAARYLPSRARQQARQARLPEPVTLQRELDAALADTDFVPEVFDDFLRDVERARTAPPMHLQDLAGTPLATTLSGLLREADGGATALISVSGIRDDAAFLAAARDAGIAPVDMKAASESLVVQYRERVLFSLAVAALLLAATVWLSLRDPHRTLRVLLPMGLTTLIIIAVLRVFGIELNLFHLVALILAAGLGLDDRPLAYHAGVVQPRPPGADREAQPDRPDHRQVREDEPPEDRGHDERGCRDDLRPVPEPGDDGLARGLAVGVRLLHARDEEHLVVHRQAEEDDAQRNARRRGEHQHRGEQRRRAGRRP